MTGTTAVSASPDAPGRIVGGGAGTRSIDSWRRWALRNLSVLSLARVRDPSLCVPAAAPYSTIDAHAAARH